MNTYTEEELLKLDVIELYKMVLKQDEIKKFPNGFWKQAKGKEYASECTKYLIEKILKYDEEMLKEKNSQALFNKNRLSGMLQMCFKGSPYLAIENAYPGKYKEWEFKSVPMGYWEKKENGIKATKWLIEEKLKLSDEELKEQLSKKLFTENGLTGMLKRCFNNSPYEVINTAYPSKFDKSDFKGYKD